MSFQDKLVLKSATTISLHERFTQLRNIKPIPATGPPEIIRPKPRIVSEEIYQPQPQRNQYHEVFENPAPRFQQRFQPRRPQRPQLAFQVQF